MEKIKTIGFFGDSFAEHIKNDHSIKNNYRTYIETVLDHYGAEIKNIGMGGSSIWDLYLTQLKPLIDSDTVPDVCVFVWTIPQRLFHRTCRSIHLSAALAGYNPKKEEWFTKEYPGVPNWFSKDIWDAAQQYFIHFYDPEKAELEYISFLQYLDNNVFPELSKKTKIVHCWSFANPRNWELSGFHPTRLSYHYRWKHGVEIRPALISLSVCDDGRTFFFPMIDDRANHIDGTLRNGILSDWLIDAIDNYQSGSLLDHSHDIVSRWQHS